MTRNGHGCHSVLFISVNNYLACMQPFQEVLVFCTILHLVLLVSQAYILIKANFIVKNVKPSLKYSYPGLGLFKIFIFIMGKRYGTKELHPACNRS